MSEPCGITNTLLTYPVTVSITGLLGTGEAGDSVKLQNNGADTITEQVDGTYSFPTELQSGAAYDVTVSSQPATQTCTVSNGTGTVADGPVTDPAVDCVDNPVYVPVPVLDRNGLALLMLLLLGMGIVGVRRFA